MLHTLSDRVQVQVEAVGFVKALLDLAMRAERSALSLPPLRLTDVHPYFHYMYHGISTCLTDDWRSGAVGNSAAMRPGSRWPNSPPSTFRCRLSPRRMRDSCSDDLCTGLTTRFRISLVSRCRRLDSLLSPQHDAHTLQNTTDCGHICGCYPTSIGTTWRSTVWRAGSRQRRIQRCLRTSSCAPKPSSTW